MISRLYRFFARIFLKYEAGIIHYLSNEKVSRIKNSTNVTIGGNIFLGKGSSINIKDGISNLEIGNSFFMRDYCSILLYPGSKLVIGEKVFFNNYCSLNCLFDIEIGSGCSFGEGVKIYDHNHAYHYESDGTLKLERDQYTYGKVRIGKNCWLGSNVTILKGVEIGDNVIIGANCLVYKSIPSGSVVKHVENLEITTGKQ